MNLKRFNLSILKCLNKYTFLIVINLLIEKSYYKHQTKPFWDKIIIFNSEKIDNIKKTI